MDFIVKLLFLGGKYISQAAGRTILEIYLRSKDIGRHISLQYEKASEIIKPYDNMLELINDRAKETEDDVHIAQMNNSLKKQMEEHVDQMPKMLKSDYINGLAKNHSLLGTVKQWEQTYANKQTVIENESGFVEGKETDYDKIYSDLCTDLFRSSPIGVSICNLGLNNLGQTISDFPENSKLSKASAANNLRKPSRPYTSQTFTEISDKSAKLHHAALEDVELKSGHPNVEMFDFNTSIAKDKESEDELGVNLKTQMKYQVNFNANSWQYGKDASYMKYLVEQSPATSYFNAKAIGIESVEGMGSVADKKEQNRSGCIQKIKRSNKLLDVDEIIQSNNKNIMQGLQQEIENRMLLIKKNKEHFKNFESNLHQRIIRSKIRHIANDVESRSSILTQNASHYSVFESKLEKNLKRKVSKILTKRKLSSGRISNRKEDFADNIKEISDLLKINDKEFRKLERKITQILLRRGLDGVLNVNYKEINKPICKSYFSNSDEEDMREREKILEINRKVFDKFEKDMSKIVILEKNPGMDKDDKVVSEKFTKYHVNTTKLSSNVLAKNCGRGIESDFVQPRLKRILSTRDKDDIRERANILEANAKAFELFERCLKNTTAIKSNHNLQLSRTLTSKSGAGGSGKNKDGSLNEDKNVDDFNDDLESAKVIKTLKELLEKSTIFKAPKSYTRSNKINLSKTDFVKIKKGTPQKSFHKEKIPRYVSPVKTESHDKNKQKTIGVMNEKPKDYYEEYINKIKSKRIRKTEDKNNKSDMEITQEKLKKFTRSTDLEKDGVTRMETQASLVDTNCKDDKTSMVSVDKQQEICKRNNKTTMIKNCDRQNEAVIEKHDQNNEFVNIMGKTGISKNSENTKIPILHKYHQLDDHENTIDQTEPISCEEISLENRFGYSKQPQIKKKIKEPPSEGDISTSNIENKIPTRSIKKEKILLAEIEETKIPLRKKSDIAKGSETIGKKLTSRHEYGKPLKDTKSESSIMSERTNIFNQNKKSYLSEQPSKLPRYSRNSNETSCSTSCLDNFKLDHDTDASNKRLSRLDVANIIKHNKGSRTAMGIVKMQPTKNIVKDDLLNVEKANKIKNDRTNCSNEVQTFPTSNDGLQERSVQNNSCIVSPHSFKKRRELTSKVHKCMNDLREIEVELNTLESSSQEAKHLRECEFKKSKKNQHDEILIKIKKLTKSEDEPGINSEEIKSASSKIPQLKKIASPAKMGNSQVPENREIIPNDREVKGNVKKEDSFIKNMENLSGVMNKAKDAYDSKIISASQQILKALEIIEKASADKKTNKLLKEPAIAASVKPNNLNVNTPIQENKSEMRDIYIKGIHYTADWDTDLKSSSKTKEFGKSVSKNSGIVQEMEPGKEKLMKVVDNTGKLLRFAKDYANTSVNSQFRKNQDDNLQIKTLQKENTIQGQTGLKKEINTSTAIEKSYHDSCVKLQDLKIEVNPTDNKEKYRVLTREASLSKNYEGFSEGKTVGKLEDLSKFRTSRTNKLNLNTDTRSRINQALQKRREVIFPKASQNVSLTANKQASKSPEKLTNLNYSSNTYKHTTDKSVGFKFDKNEPVVKTSSNKKGTPNDSESSSKGPQNNSNGSFDDNNPKNKNNIIYNILKNANSNADKKNEKKDEITSKERDGDYKLSSSDGGISVGRYHLKKIIAFVPEDILTLERLQKQYSQIHSKENKNIPTDSATTECCKEQNLGKTNASLDCMKSKTSGVKSMEEKQNTKVTTEAQKFSCIPLRRSNVHEDQKRKDVSENNIEKNKIADEGKSSEKCDKQIKHVSPPTSADTNNIKGISEEVGDLNKQHPGVSLNREHSDKKQDDKPIILTSLKDNLKPRSLTPQKEAPSEADFKKTSIDTEVSNNKSEMNTLNKLNDGKNEALKTQNKMNNERNIPQSKIAVRKERVKVDEKEDLGTSEQKKLVYGDTNLLKLEKRNTLKKEVDNQNGEKMLHDDLLTKDTSLAKSVEEEPTSQSSKIVKDTDKIKDSTNSSVVTNLPFKYAKFAFALPKKIIKSGDTNNNKENIKEIKLNKEIKDGQKRHAENVPENSTTSAQGNKPIPLKKVQTASTSLKESLDEKFDRELSKLIGKIKETDNASLGDKFKKEKILSEKRSSTVSQSDSQATRIPKSIPKISDVVETKRLPHSNDHKPSIASDDNKNINLYSSKDENKVLSEKRSSTIPQTDSHTTRIPKSIQKISEVEDIRKSPQRNDYKPPITLDEHQNIGLSNTKKMKYSQPITENVPEQLKTTSENKTKSKSAETNEKKIEVGKGAVAQKYIASNEDRNLKRDQSHEVNIDSSMFKIDHKDVTPTKLDKLTEKLRNQSAVRYNMEKSAHHQETSHTSSKSAKIEVTSTVSQNIEEQNQLIKEQEEVDQVKTESEENTTSKTTTVPELGALFRNAKFSFKPPKKPIEKDDQQAKKEVAEQDTQESKVDESLEGNQDPFPKHLSPLLRYFMHKKLVKVDQKKSTLKPKEDLEINHETSATQKLLLKTNKQSYSKAIDIKPDNATNNVYTRYPFLKKHKTRKKIPQCAWEWKMKFVSQAKHKKHQNVYTEDCQPAEPETSRTKIKCSGNNDSNCNKSHKIITKVPASKYSIFTRLPIHDAISKSHLKSNNRI